MITKGNQRGGGRQLATHLLNQFDNERVELVDLRGSVARDLHGAFHEWYAHSMATKAQKYLFSLSINPDLEKYDLTREQYLDFIARTERSLNLVGQPRAVVFHTKNGREHAHVVWSRIDVDAGKAVHLAHTRLKLRSIAQEFAREHGLELPPRSRENGRKDRFNDRAKASNLAEKQQEARSGISKEERMAAILRAWKEARDAHGFVTALEQEGYFIARGDSRDYVVIDRAGEVHSLTRQLAGTIKGNEVKALLAADYPPDKLHDVETARQHAQAVRDYLRQEQLDQERERGIHEKAEALRARQAELRRQDLDRRQRERRATVERERLTMLDRMAQERQALADLQRGENDGVASSRKPPGRIVAFLSRITGIQAWIDYRRHRDDEARQQDHRRQAQALDARHERERQEIDRRARDLAAIDAREKHSLETALAREDFQRIAGRDDKVLQPEFTRAAAARKDIVKEQGDEGRQPGLSGGARRDTRIEKGTLTALFNRLFRHGADGGRDVTRDSDARLRETSADRGDRDEPLEPSVEQPRLPDPGDLSRTFRDAANPRRPRERTGRSPDPPGRER